jgi:CheY-like chemotaxis protein
VAALEALEASIPAVILLDLMMPEMDGFEFIERLDTREVWKDIPVVVITAMDLTVEERMRLERRVERVLQKGAYAREDLLQLVRDKVSAHARKRARGAAEGGSP